MKPLPTLESPPPATTTTVIPVVVVSANEIIRHGLAAMIDNWNGFRVVAETVALAELSQNAERRSERVAIIHERFPSDSFTKELRDLLIRAPGLRVIALFDDCDRIGLHPMVRMDVAGILNLGIAASDLRSAMEKVCDGKRVFDAEVKRSILQETARPELSDREVDTVQRLVEGMSNQSIANSLGISAETVKHHIKSLLRKLSASNRTEAAIKAVQFGIARCPGDGERATGLNPDERGAGLVVI